MRKTAAILCWLLTAGAASAHAAETAAFLKISLGARPFAMGEAFTAVADDLNALAFNPAGLAQIGAREAAFMHAELFADMRYDFIGYAHPMRRLGTVSFGFARLGHGAIEGREARIVGKLFKVLVVAKLRRNVDLVAAGRIRAVIVDPLNKRLADRLRVPRSRFLQVLVKNPITAIEHQSAFPIDVHELFDALLYAAISSVLVLPIGGEDDAGIHKAFIRHAYASSRLLNSASCRPATSAI